ncbi:transposase [bacterium]|nr:transposase [bacterium]
MQNNDVNEAHRLSDAIWEQIEPLLPPVIPNPRGGRPRMDDRKAMEAILYALHIDFKWTSLPRSLGSPNTIRKRFQEWRRAGVFERMWRSGLLTYDELRALFWHGRRRTGT